ncbi:MAG TPA: hypothetical protein VE173_16445 [Longimicrobiales bacterium]|jgi:hypothetical protein|nr:hypothetical protein [Longimicrobiales bacterium]
MARLRSRRWTDRDGTEWEIVHEPPVELDNLRVRRLRERLVLLSGREKLQVPAAYGADLTSLTDGDLQGLLDQAREGREARGSASPWEIARRKG